MQNSIILHLSGFALYAMVKKLFRQNNTIFFLLLLPNTPRCVKWTIPRLLYQARRNTPLVYKGFTVITDYTPLSIQTLSPNLMAAELSLLSVYMGESSKFLNPEL